MIASLLSETGVAITALVVVLAFLEGDEPERFGAGALMICVYASYVIHESGVIGPEAGVTVVDALFLLVCIGIGWKSRRAWPFWASAIQILIILTDVLTLSYLTPATPSLYHLTELASFGVLIALGTGVFQAWRDRVAGQGPIDLPRH